MGLHSVDNDKSSMGMAFQCYIKQYRISYQQVTWEQVCQKLTMLWEFIV